MTRSFQLCRALLAGASTCTFALAAHAQEAPAPKPIRTFKIKARINPGDLAYRWVFEDQKLLQSYLPRQGGMVDFSWRITFTELNLAEQDAWQPKGWAAALVGRNFEQDLPVARGGYFLLPALPTGLQGATIMFREQSMPGHIAAAWRVRVGAGQRLSYAGFQQAMNEIKSAQDAISPREAGLKQVRTGQYDALKACFLEGGGRVLVDGAPAADNSIGNCVVLKFDSVKAAGARNIEFQGPLDRVTVVESADYASNLDLPMQALAPRTRSEGDDGAASGAPMNAAPTNLTNLSYGWNFKRQLRLQGARPPKYHLVDFVWRMSLDGLSEAEQDAWTPRDWALALAGKDFARKVPVARGGYFLLPALPPGRQDATLVFKERDRRNLVGAAWVVRLRKGPRPFLYYGEVREAMNAVRKAQEAIPDGNAELATLRAAHYDGLKACFLEDGGVVFVGDTPTADATVGNCRVLKFNPAENVNQTIEFVGELDAVTMVDTAAYLQAKG